MSKEWAIGDFKKYEANPIITPDMNSWDNTHVSNPAVVLKDGRYCMLYRGERGNDIGICLAFSDDGINFTRYGKNPVIATNEKEDRPHDPRIWYHDGLYYLTYNAWCSSDLPCLNISKGDADELWSKQVVYQCVATSKDLITWERHGVLGIKNGCIVTDASGQAVKINGKFLMYGHCQGSFMGISDDLLHWEIRLVPFLKDVPGILETCMAVTGIPGRQKEDIIIFTAVRPKPPVRFALSQCMYSWNDPEKMIHNLEEPFLLPEHPWEVEGYKGPGVPFIILFMDTGLVRNGNEWRLYYGGADHVICLATAKDREIAV